MAKFVCRHALPCAVRTLVRMHCHYYTSEHKMHSVKRLSGHNGVVRVPNNSNASTEFNENMECDFVHVFLNDKKSLLDLIVYRIFRQHVQKCIQMWFVWHFGIVVSSSIYFSKEESLLFLLKNHFSSSNFIDELQSLPVISTLALFIWFR